MMQRVKALEAGRPNFSKESSITSSSKKRYSKGKKNSAHKQGKEKEKVNEENEQTVGQYQATNKCLEVREKYSLGLQKQPSFIQLVKGSDETLEATLATGANVLLKISMALKNLGRYTEKENMDVLVRLFFADFASSPLDHLAINFKIKVDCEATPVRCVLPHKPPSFESYGQFSQWLGQGYFNNQVNVAYDFSVDVENLAPSLAQHLFFFRLEAIVSLEITWLIT